MQMPELTAMNPAQMSPLTLAFVGDGIYELLARSRVVSRGSMPAGNLHRQTVRLVCAAAQSEACDRIEPLLTEEEQDILRRGRNANSTAVPRHAAPADYRRATALEALFGYLYLCGRMERIEALFHAAWGNGEDSSDGKKI